MNTGGNSMNGLTEDYKSGRDDAVPYTTIGGVKVYSDGYLGDEANGTQKIN